MGSPLDRVLSFCNSWWQFFSAEQLMILLRVALIPQFSKHDVPPRLFPTRSVLHTKKTEPIGLHGG